MNIPPHLICVAALPCEIQIHHEDMNKSLELNVWPFLYDSIIFLCLQTRTPEVCLKLNII